MNMMMTTTLPLLAVLAVPAVKAATPEAVELRGDLLRVAAARYDLRQDIRDVAGEAAEVQASRAALRTDVRSWLSTVREHGAGSAEAVEARQRVERSQLAFHRDRMDFRRDLWDASLSRRRLALERLELLKDARDARMVGRERVKALAAIAWAGKEKRDLARDIAAGAPRREIRREAIELAIARRAALRQLIRTRIAEHVAARR